MLFLCRSTCTIHSESFVAFAVLLLLLAPRLPPARVLLTAYAAHLQPAWFTEAAYLWAVELWYAYAIQVGAD